MLKQAKETLIFKWFDHLAGSNSISYKGITRIFPASIV
jgi:hypothetical protein